MIVDCLLNVRQASAALKVGEGTNADITRDGKSIYYQRFLPGEDAVSIWRFDMATNQHSQLVVGIHPAISPDGRYLAYAKFNDATGRTALWVLDLFAQQELQVVADEQRAVVLPRWSPDGRRILFTLNQGGLGNREANQEVPFVGADIAVVNRDGTGMTVITDNPVNDIGRAWDGGYVYFTSHREKSVDLWRFKPNFVDEPAPVVSSPAPSPSAPPIAQPAAPPPAPVPPAPPPGDAPPPAAPTSAPTAPPPPP